VEPEKQTLLANGSETTFVSRQRLCKHVPAATDTHESIELLLEKVVSTRSLQRVYKKDIWVNRVSSVREAVKKRDRESGSRREPPIREDLSAEAEE
jgi:hypothetical protein